MTVGGGHVPKQIYDRTLSEWTSKYVKNKRDLDRTSGQCEQLRHEALKLQNEVEASNKELDQMEDQFNGELMVKYEKGKNAYEVAVHQKQVLSNQIAENRKLKTTLTKEKNSLTSDYDRKYSELTKTLEHRARLDKQLEKLAGDLTKLTDDRRSGENRLKRIRAALAENAEVVADLESDLMEVHGGVQATLDGGMLSAYHGNFNAGNN